MSEQIQGSLSDEEEQIARVMRDLLGSLPEGAATLEIKRDPSGVIFRLRPANKRSAAFGIHYDGCTDVFFGRGTTFELPLESGLPKDADFEAIMQWARAMGQAVIAGECKERAGFLGVRGTIWVNRKAFRVTSFIHFRLLPRTFHYAPYHAQGPVVREASRATSL